MEKMVDKYMEDLDKQAQAKWRAGRLHEVEALYTQMAAHRPQHADSHFNIALVRTALGDLDGAIVALEEALRLPVGVPHHTFYYQQLGMVKCKKAERTNDHVLWDAGLRALARAVQADPLNVNAWATAATNYMALGHERSAMRATEAAARLGTAREQALSALGVNYARVGRVSEAIRLFTQALAQNPGLHRTRAELLHAACAVADWRGYEATVADAVAHTRQQVAAGELTHLQPFDALAHPIDSGGPA